MQLEGVKAELDGVLGWSHAPSQARSYVDTHSYFQHLCMFGPLMALYFNRLFLVRR